jgi:ADP-ribosylglycohydrolase
MTSFLNRRSFIKTSSLSTASIALLSPLTACAAPAKKNKPKDETLLFKKVYGALIGAAIGDAIGGPVEFWHHKDIEKKYGILDKLLPYGIEPSDHGPWKKDPGTYTDDTRLSKVFCQAVINAQAPPTDKDIAKAIIDYYYAAPEGLPKNWIEEYYYEAIYREDKEIYGGQPTNGGIMAIAPLGVINPCNPQQAFDDAFDAVFVAQGYARWSAATAAAAISSAMKLGSTVDTIITDALDSLKNHKAKVEGPRWPACPHYKNVALKNEQLIQKGLDIAKKYNDPYKLRDELLPAIAQQFGPDGAESLAIAFTMLHAAKGDYIETIKGCVNFGRDNDSSASVAGAITGALHGTDAIPKDWIKTVEDANDKPTFESIANQFCKIITKKFHEDKKALNDIQKLI